MAGGKQAASMPTFSSIEELVEHFETHDLGDQLDALPEARFDVQIGRRRQLVEIDGEVAELLAQEARKEHTTTRDLVDRWLKERLAGVA